MGPWEHCILQCIPTCHGILWIPDPEMCTCGTLGSLGCGTLRTLDPEIYTCHGTLGTQDPELCTWHGTLGTQDPEMYIWRGTLGTQDPEMYTWRGTLRILDLDFLPWHMSGLYEPHIFINLAACYFPSHALITLVNSNFVVCVFYAD